MILSPVAGATKCVLPSLNFPFDLYHTTEQVLIIQISHHPDRGKEGVGGVNPTLPQLTCDFVAALRRMFPPLSQSPSPTYVQTSTPVQLMALKLVCYF